MDALKDHQLAELVNTLRDIAAEYHGTQQLRERIAHAVRAALPSDAAQAPTIQQEILGMSQALKDFEATYKPDSKADYFVGGYSAGVEASCVTAVAPAAAAPSDVALRERVERLLTKLHNEGQLSEGQCAKVLDIDRISWRKIVDEAALTGAHAQPLVESAEQPAIDVEIAACALMIKGICLAHPSDDWMAKIEARIRFMLKSYARRHLSDEGIIERCKSVGIQWLPAEPDHGFPGSFDLVEMSEMRALIAIPSFAASLTTEAGSDHG